MNIQSCDLSAKNCKPCEGYIPPLKPGEADLLLKQLKDWAIRDIQLVKEFRFRNYFETIAFVNATAWLSHREDHHPDLEVSYNRCVVRYSTHAIGGLSENDFICAAKIDALLEA